VLLNLILNGCEALSGNAQGERALSLTVRVDDGHVHFAVRDRGTGIDPSVLDRLFEPFVTTTRRPRPRPLDLADDHLRPRRVPVGGERPRPGRDAALPAAARGPAGRGHAARVALRTVLVEWILRPCGDRTHDTLLKRQALYH
jgi:hypothetical protein